nr:uncharacterized protein CI109_000989 [Kwoniella shandongensis]KAA5530809.1 hypothetical protein CI109_000989 [Kwoniella shandongensis]
MSASLPPQEPVTGSLQASSSSRSSAPLIPTLSRLSNATSRPTLPRDAEDDSYASKTMRFVSRGGKEVWRRSGLSSMWKDEDGASLNSKDPDVHPRTSLESVSSSSVAQKLRSQPLDTSSILYPTLTTHPAPTPHHILVLSLAHINRAPPSLNNDELFNILLRRLEPWVGEEAEGGYVLVILAAESPDPSSKGKAKETRKLPGVAWWVWKWKRIPKKWVPEEFEKTPLLPLILPFLSPKSYPKLHPLPSLLSLHYTHSVSLKGIDVSLPVLEAEARILRSHPNIVPTRTPRAPAVRPSIKKHDSDSSIASWGYQTISSAVGTAASYLPIPTFGFGAESNGMMDDTATAAGYWGRDVTSLVNDCGGRIPPLLVQLRKAILSECVRTEGVFRRGSNSELLSSLVAVLGIPIESQPNLPWNELARQDPLLPPKILSKFLTDLASPIIGPDLYDKVRSIKESADLQSTLIPALSPAVRSVLDYVVRILYDLSKHESVTKMSPFNLAIVIAPCLISGPDPLEDAEMCLAPGKTLPAAMRQLAGGGKKDRDGGEGTVVGFLDLWIRNYPAVSGRGEDVEETARSRTNGRAGSMDGNDPSQSAATTTRQNRSGSVRHSLLGHETRASSTSIITGGE